MEKEGNNPADEGMKEAEEDETRGGGTLAENGRRERENEALYSDGEEDKKSSIAFYLFVFLLPCTSLPLVRLSPSGWIAFLSVWLFSLPFLLLSFVSLDSVCFSMYLYSHSPLPL